MHRPDSRSDAISILSDSNERYRPSQASTSSVEPMTRRAPFPWLYVATRFDGL